MNAYDHRFSLFLVICSQLPVTRTLEPFSISPEGSSYRDSTVTELPPHQLISNTSGKNLIVVTLLSGGVSVEAYPKFIDPVGIQEGAFVFGFMLEGTVLFANA